MVSISRGGIISFNKAARVRYGLDGRPFAAFWFDAPSRIGLELVSEECGGSKVRLEQSGASVAARGFLRCIGYDMEVARRFPIAIEGQWLVIDVNGWIA
jgi:hypothetical protein